MALVLSSPQDLVNAALVRIGYRSLIGHLYDGSEAAQLALAIYGQTRDEMLRTGDLGFAERSAVLTLLKQAPVGGYVPPAAWSDAYPSLPWLYEYEYPDDMLKLRIVKPPIIFVPNFDPQPNIFSIANDIGYTPAKKVILCNVDSAIAIYTGQVTNPQQWDATFAEALVEALAERLSPALAKMTQGGAEAAKAEAAEAGAGQARAEITQG